MTRSQSSLEEILKAHLQTLALSLQPETVKGYRGVVRSFLAYLQRDFPQVRRLSQLRRDPHILGWFRCMCEQQPPLCNGTRINYTLRLRAGYCMTWPPMAMFFNLTSFVARIFLPKTAICLEHYPCRRIRPCSWNCAKSIL
jgi:hypothetical protein